jgi:hypothetical protein
MKKLMLTLSIAAMGMFGAELKGSISDSGCGAKHGPGKENAGCVKGCIAKGGAPVLVTADGKVIKIHNADAVTEKFYGKAVTITGAVTGDSVHIEKITE